MKILDTRKKKKKWGSYTEPLPTSSNDSQRAFRMEDENHGIKIM